MIATVAVLVSKTRRSPPLTHVLWCLVLIKLCTPPIVDVPLPPTLWAAQGIAGAPCEPRPEPECAGAEAGAFAFDERPDASHAASADSGMASIPLVGAEHEPCAGESSDATACSVQSLPAPEASDPVTTEVAMAIGRTSETSAPAGLFGVFVIAWAAGSLIFSAMMVRRYASFRRLLNTGQPASFELQARTASFAKFLGIKHCPEVVVVDACVPPLVWSGMRRPKIVLPLALVSALDTAQQETVLLHELAHIRRGDHRLRWFDTAALIALWWHPLAWWGRTALRRAEEECCDAWVVWALPRHSREYGRALLETVEFLTESVRVPLVTGTTLGGSELRRRVKMIVDARVHRQMSVTSLVFVLVVAALALPVRGQRSDTDPPENSCCGTPQAVEMNHVEATTTPTGDRVDSAVVTSTMPFRRLFNESRVSDARTSRFRRHHRLTLHPRPGFRPA